MTTNKYRLLTGELIHDTELAILAPVRDVTGADDEHCSTYRLVLILSEEVDQIEEAMISDADVWGIATVAVRIPRKQRVTWRERLIESLTRGVPFELEIQPNADPCD